MDLSLRNLTFSTTEIKTPGGTFSVRGLSLNDITVLANTYGPELALIFGRLSGGTKVSQNDIETLIPAIAKEFPDLVAATIALAADEYTPESVQNVKKLSFNYQYEALEAIAKNTFQSEAELKKFLGAATHSLTGVTRVIQGLRLPNSTSGSGESDGR